MTRGASPGMADAPEHMLALIPNWLGDVAMCTPALRALHRRFPGARFAVAGRKTACALLNGLPWLDEFITLPARPGIAETMRLARQLTPHGRDLAVVFPHSFRAALMAFLARSSRRVGYDRNGRGFLLTDRVAPYREDGKIQPVYMAHEYVDLVKSLGCEDDGAGLELAADQELVESIGRRFSGNGPKVGFAPGAAFGPSKRWLPERFAQVADALAEKTHAQCVLLTGPGEEDTRDQVMEAAATGLTICDDGNPTIETLKATIAGLDLLVCNDSGPRHVAIGFGVPTICIMGSTSPRYSAGPYEQGEVIRIDVDCGPCQKPVCEEDHRCMTGIAADTVTEAALRHLPS